MTEQQRLQELIAESGIITAAAKVKLSQLRSKRLTLLLGGTCAAAIRRFENEIAHNEDVVRIESERVRVANVRLKEITSDFGYEGETPQQTYDRLVERKTALEARERAARFNPARIISAAEAEELRILGGRIHELSKTGRAQGWLAKEVA